MAPALPSGPAELVHARDVRELREIGEELRDDPELRALVVIGDGRGSSGIDTSVFAGDALDGDTLETDRDALLATTIPPSTRSCRPRTRTRGSRRRRTRRRAARLRSAPGSSSRWRATCACSPRIEGRPARVQVRHPPRPRRHSTAPAVGAAKAKELIFTASQIDAEEAFRIGLTQRLVPDAELEPTVRELAATIAAQPPLAVEGAKRAVNVAGTVPTRDGLRIEAEGQAVCLRSDDMKEAIAVSSGGGRRATSAASGSDGRARRPGQRSARHRGAAAATKKGSSRWRRRYRLTVLATCIPCSTSMRCSTSCAPSAPAPNGRGERAHDRRHWSSHSGGAAYELVTRMRACRSTCWDCCWRAGEAQSHARRRQHREPQARHALSGLPAMGAELEIVHGLIEAQCRTPCGTRIVLEFPSVGATENLLTAAVLAKGQTVLDNAAREPEVSDLAAFLNRMRADLGAGRRRSRSKGSRA